MMKRLLLPLLPFMLLVLLWLIIQPPLGQATDGPGETPLQLTVDEPDGRLGVCYGFYEDPPESGQRPYLDLAYAAGARHDRWDFSWTAIQPNNQDQWNWSGHERIVQAETAKSVGVLGILLWTPPWAATYQGLTGWAERLAALVTASARSLAHANNPVAPNTPTLFSSSPPRNLYEPAFVNGQINRGNYWGYYAYHLAKHFDGSDPTLRVDAWEMWNEPDWTFFWSGSPEDYCQLLKVGYKAIKGEDGATGGNPDATVLFGAMLYWLPNSEEFFDRVLDCLAADPAAAQNNYFFDVMSVHFYSRSDNTYEEVNEVKAKMAARGMVNHPVWLTETGAPMYGDTPYHPKSDNWLSIDEEAAYVLQSYANALAAGVERYFFFRAHDADMGEPHGLMRNDKSLRPAYSAYQVAAEYLKGENQVTRVPKDGATRVSLWGTPRGKVSVLWNRTPNPVAYGMPAAMPSATLVDRWGTTQSINAVNGYYTLTLPVATANLESDPGDYIVGGDPLILVETDTISPTSALGPLPPLTLGSAITLTWTASDAESGIWYLQIQSSTNPDGPWTTVASLNETQGVTQTVIHVDEDAVFYFRARARDQVGNWELWPSGYEVRTDVDANTELHWQVDALYNDSNRNGVWDPPVGSGSLKPEITLTHVSLRFLDPDWQVITSAISNSWQFTRTLLPGTYTFIAQWRDDGGEDWLTVDPIVIDGTVDPLYEPVSRTVGLLPSQALYLPIYLINGLAPINN
jgi:hypothetical protein